MNAITTAADFGTAVRQARRLLKVKQRDVALAAGVGVRFIVDLESGKPTCELGKSLQVAKVLGLNIASEPPVVAGADTDLLPDEEDTSPHQTSSIAKVDR